MKAPAKKYKILIVDDHPIFRQGVATLINAEPDFAVCEEATCAENALKAVEAHNPDVALVDISLLDTNGLELIRLMRAVRPKLPILMLSMHEESEYAVKALKAKASGYLMKAEAPDTMLTAIRKVLAGELYFSKEIQDRLIFKVTQNSDGGKASPVDKLSEREREVLELLGRGLGSRQIAEQLYLSIKTIETYRTHIKEKLNLKDSGETVRFATDWVAQKS